MPNSGRMQTFWAIGPIALFRRRTDRCESLEGCPLLVFVRPWATVASSALHKILKQRRWRARGDRCVVTGVILSVTHRSLQNTARRSDNRYDRFLFALCNLSDCVQSLESNSSSRSQQIAFVFTKILRIAKAIEKKNNQDGKALITYRRVWA